VYIKLETIGGTIMELQENLMQEIANLPEGTYALPVGVRIGGKVHRMFTLKPMDGLTEEAIADPKIRENGGKVVTKVIKGVLATLGDLQSISEDLIRNMTIADRDFIIVKSKEVSTGSSEVNFTHPCPHCEALNDIHFDTKDMQVNYLADTDSLELSFELPVGVMNRRNEICKKITITMPNGLVQERVSPIARVNPGQAKTTMLQLITVKLDGIEFLDGNVFKAMTKRDRDFISKKMDEFEAGVDMAVDTECAVCGKPFSAPVSLYTLLGE
jgi:hypothetical protein